MLAPQEVGQPQWRELSASRRDTIERYLARFGDQKPRALNLHPGSVRQWARRYPQAVAALICLDFDDTIITENMSRLVFDQFAEPGWREIQAQYGRGEISVEQANAGCVDLIPVTTSPAEIGDFAVARAELRPGLLDLADWALWHDWQLAVVSNGLDCYVHPILDAAGLDRMVRHCGRTERTYRWRARYDSPRGIEIQDRFKVSYVAAFRAAGDFVAYAGDGASDVEAARMAPAVFARDTLLERLEAEHPRLFPFETFHDIIAVLERESGRWQLEA